MKTKNSLFIYSELHLNCYFRFCKLFLKNIEVKRLKVFLLLRSENILIDKATYCLVIKIFTERLFLTKLYLMI